VPKFPRPIGHVNVELKTIVSEIPSFSIIRVDVVNDRMSPMFVNLMPRTVGVLCSRMAE
jgi:hypothetical protein